MKPFAIIPLIIAFLLGLLSRRRSQAATTATTPPLTSPDAQMGDASPAATDEGDGPIPTEPGVLLDMYGWLKEHFWFVSLAATALTAFLVIVKALVLAEGDLSTATILLSDGVSGVALSAFIACLPFMTLCAVATTGFAFAQAWKEGISMWPPVAVFLTAIALCLATTPWWLALAIAAVVVVPVLMFSSGDVETSIDSAGWTGLWIVAVVGVLTGAIAGQWITMGRMWIPAESILIQATSTDPAAPAPTTDQLVGYVITEEGNYLTVLLEEDRLLTYVEADDVVGRARCELEREWSELPLPVAIWGGAADKYDPC